MDTELLLLLTVTIDTNRQQAGKEQTETATLLIRSKEEETKHFFRQTKEVLKMDSPLYPKLQTPWNK